MIPSQTFETYAPFGDNATKVQPDSAKYSAGFQQADVLPAEWMNWAWNKNTKGITDLNEGLSSVEAEINSVLSAYGITPDKTKTDQLKTALAKIPPQITTCSTAAATAAKSIAISGSSLRAGNVYAIEMTYGNTAASPTLSINSGTAYPLCDCKGSALGSGAWQAGEIITVLFTGTKYLMASNPVNEIANNNPYPVTSGAVSCLIASGTTLTGPRLGVGGVIKVMFTQDINLATAADVLELTYNSIVYPVKVCKNGALADVGIHEIASGTYSCIQAYTTIELVFNGSVFVIVGNPVLLSGSDYTIYSDGKIGEDIVGTVKSLATMSLPYGWLECDGSSVLRSDYPELFNLFSTQTYDSAPNHTLLSVYGSADSTHFNLPDYREVALVGAGKNTTDVKDSTEGGTQDHMIYTVGLFGDDMLQDHNHYLNAQNIYGTGSQWATYWNGTSTVTNRNGNIANGRTGTVTQGKRKGVKYIIKAL